MQRVPLVIKALPFAAEIANAGEVGPNPENQLQAFKNVCDCKVDETIQDFKKTWPDPEFR